MTDVFRIAYAGGGSRFVVTFLHGLAAYADALRALGRPLALVLLDPNTARAQEMARYAEIVRQERGLPLTVTVTGDRDAALAGSDWVMFSIGIWEEARPLARRLHQGLFPGNREIGPPVAIEAACEWPYVQQFATAMQRHCPRAVFATLTNPTDVLAAAVNRRYGLRAVGICVEVPQLIRWLAYQLRVPYEDVEIEYLGVNHCGWVSRWSLAGRRGEQAAAMLEAALRERGGRNSWDPLNDAFVHVWRLSGHLRTSPYHHDPYVLDWSEARRQRHQVYDATRKPEGGEDGLLQAAWAQGRMIEEDDPLRHDTWFQPYRWPSTRFTLGTLALGLAGGAAGPVPIQARNGSANPVLPPDAWLEAPTRVADGEIRPQPVPPLPDWILSQLRLLAHQRMLLAEWLATDRAEALTEALLLWPNVTSTDRLLSLGRELAAAKDRAL